MRGRAGGQLELALFSGWGGKRAGAGRKAREGRRFTPHRARGVHRGAEPVHVTMRAHFRPLRSQFVFPTLRHAIALAGKRFADFRVVHFSVQWDHVHLIVEAENTAALCRGMRGLAVRIARRVNALVARKGKFWADRWHGRALSSPRAVRRALVYVIANWRKHGESAAGPIDEYSSGPYFEGFAHYAGRTPFSVDRRVVPRALAPPVEAPVQSPCTWLLVRGWRRHRLLSVHEGPKQRRAIPSTAAGTSG